MGEVEPYDWGCHSDTTPASSFGELIYLELRNLQQKAGSWKYKPFFGKCRHFCFKKKLLSCNYPDKAAPGAQHLHQLLSQHQLASRPGVSNVVVNPPCPAFSTTLIFTAKSQPGLLPLITWVPCRLPCPLGSSSQWLSDCFTITDMQLKDYLLTVEGFCFVFLQTSIPACIK